MIITSNQPGNLIYFNNPDIVTINLCSAVLIYYLFNKLGAKVFLNQKVGD